MIIVIAGQTRERTKREFPKRDPSANAKISILITSSSAQLERTLLYTQLKDRFFCSVTVCIRVGSRDTDIYMQKKSAHTRQYKYLDWNFSIEI
jgi:hypothetical protein